MPPTPTLQSLSTTQRCSCHPLAWITQLFWMGTLTDDAVSAASGACVTFPRRGQILSWVHPLPHSTIGATVSGNQASSCAISVHCHHPAWPGNTVGLSLGGWSTGVRDLVLPAACAGLVPLVRVTEALLGVNVRSAKGHLLSGTLQSPRAHLNEHFAAPTVTHPDVSWTEDTQRLELKHYPENTEGATL